ncbi:MAG: metal ABC transporter permease [Pseudomonadota bacterium]
MTIDPFLLRVALAGVGVAVAAGPLGCFVLWRRMAYFGDATAHAALLGVAISIALNTPIMLPVLFCALGMAWLVVRLGGAGLATDGALGVTAHAALAIGLVAVSLLPATRVDLMGFLIGDILAVGTWDLIVIWCGAILVLAMITWRWQPLLMSTLNPELAQASGIKPEKETLVLMVTLAIVVAVALQVVGTLLVAALLLIPAAAARPLAHTPEGMAMWAALIGAASAFAGIAASFIWDTPTGPSIVAAATAFFLVSRLLRSS